MANISITEYHRLFRDASGYLLPIASEPSEGDQQVSYTSSTASTAFGSSTYFVRLAPDSDCYVSFGDAPTATATSQKLFAGSETWRAVRPGQKVAIYDGTS